MEKNHLNLMFDNLLHIWNKTNYWNPRMREYIYGSVNWIHVINLVKTAEKMEEVRNSLKELATSWKKILFVSTKLQWRDAFSKLAEDTGHYYVSEKWVPGLLTNFKTIRKRIMTYQMLLKDSETWAFDVLTKKEKATKMLELEKLHKSFKWLKEMKKIPEVLFIVDSVYESQAVKEWNSLKLNIFSIWNTNASDLVVENLIPANTNSVLSIEFIANYLREVLVWIKPATLAKKIPSELAKKPVSWNKKPYVKPAQPKTEKKEEK